MYWVLVHLSGIPPLEDMPRSRGDVFRAYQKRTRAFFPLPLKWQSSAEGLQIVDAARSPGTTAIVPLSASIASPEMMAKPSSQRVMSVIDLVCYK